MRKLDGLKRVWHASFDCAQDHHLYILVEDMAYSVEYRNRIVDLLGAIVPIRAKAMFGGVGLYGDELFFALIDEDRLYFKVDDVSRRNFEAEGMGPFVPFEGADPMRGYYEVPTRLLGDVEELTVWVDQALGVAQRAKKPKKRR